MDHAGKPLNRSDPNAGLPGVSFVIPVHNGAPWLDRVLRSVLLQDDGRPFEIIAVEDGSTDQSSEILVRYQIHGSLRLVRGPCRGATAALNEGVRQARHPIVCQIDQDVVLEPGWMTALLEDLRDPRVAAAQGYYTTPPNASIWAGVMGLDLEQRYQQILGRDVDHVCTGNTAYRADALRRIGLFDESLGYGYDNDVSYRLAQAGYRLVIQPRARSVHCWRDNWWTYLVQQYGFGYGRLDLVAKHRRRVTGDDVSGAIMMLHAPLMAVAILLGVVAAVLAGAGATPVVPATMAVTLVSVLALERLAAGIRATLAFKNTAGLFFVPVHIARDLAWTAALAMWFLRRARGNAARPDNSMRPRLPARVLPDRRA